MPDLKTLETAIDGLLNQEGMELVDLRWLQEGGRWVLRIYADKHGGTTLRDCEVLSNRVGAMLDAMEAIECSYTLEVSSPGLDRVLKKEKDFIRFAGYQVKVRLKEPLEGQRNFQGCLKGVESGLIVVDAAGKTLSIPPSSVEEARLQPDIDI
jgi:ribosome maturation factor RimP